MGMFDEVNIDEALVNDGTLPKGVYPFKVTLFEIKPTKAGTMKGLHFKATVIAGKYKGLDLFEWMRVPHPSDTAEEKEIPDYRDNTRMISVAEQHRNYLSKVKTLIVALGIPESRVGSVEPEDIVGITFLGEVYNRKGDLTPHLGNKIIPKDFSDDELAKLDEEAHSAPTNMFV